MSNIRRNQVCPKNFHTVRETAELLGVNTNTVYRYIHAGLLNAVKPRGMQKGYLVSDEELAAFPERFEPVQ